MDETVGETFKGTDWYSKMRDGMFLFDIEASEFRSLSREQALDAISHLNAEWISTVEATVWAHLIADADARMATKAYTRILFLSKTEQILAQKQLWKTHHLCTRRLYDHNCWGIERRDFEKKMLHSPLLNTLWMDGETLREQEAKTKQHAAPAKDKVIAHTGKKMTKSPRATSASRQRPQTRKHDSYHIVVPTRDIAAQTYFLVMTTGSNPKIHGLYLREEAADEAACALNDDLVSEGADNFYQVFMVPYISSRKRRRR